jgi:general L-amino acid transport system substrate-binding protein
MKTYLLAAALAAGLARSPPKRSRKALDRRSRRCGSGTRRSAAHRPARPASPSLTAAANIGGLDSDLCRALAGAVLGDATKIRWVPLTTTARLPALQSSAVAANFATQP